MQPDVSGIALYKAEITEHCSHHAYSGACNCDKPGNNVSIKIVLRALLHLMRKNP